MKRKLIVIGCSSLFASAIFGTFLLNGVYSYKEAVINEEVLEKVYYVTQIISSFCVVVGALIGIWQYVLTTRAERAKLNTECIQRAIDLSEYYKDNILSKFIPVEYVFDESGISDVLSSIPQSAIKNFDEIELNSLLTAAQRDRIKALINSDRFVQAVMQAESIFGLELDIKKNTTIIRDEDKKQVTVEVNKKAVIQKFMGNIVTETLNSLEYFCMHFTHGTADESVVYQSLHQTYIQMVYVLYYNIAVVNKGHCSKYYTNVIELYEKWSGRDSAEMLSRSASINQAVSKGNIVEKFYLSFRKM